MSATDAFFVSRTMQAMEVLVFQPSSAPQVAGALRVHPRTARRLLNRLVHDGWVIRTEGRGRTYAPSMRIVALAAHLAERSPLARAAQPVVTRLQAEWGGTAHLLIPSYRSALCLVHRAGGPDGRPQLRELVPAHATAGGKVLLAYRDPWRESVLQLPLDRTTERTIGDAVGLQAEVERVRDRGFATEDGELETGLRAVAVPVRDRDGAVAAAVACTFAGQAAEDTPPWSDDLVSALRAAARQITSELTGGDGG